MPPWTAGIGDGNEDDRTSGLKMVFCPLDLPFRESRERCKFLQFKVDPSRPWRFSPQLTKESQKTSCRGGMTMPTRTIIPSRRGYQLAACPFWPTRWMTQMSPTGGKTNLQNPRMDVTKFIRKLSTGRDTGFLESGSRAILNRTFSLDQSSPSKWTRLWTHHSWSLEIPTGGFVDAKLSWPNPFLKVPHNGFWTTFSNSDSVTTPPLDVFNSIQCNRNIFLPHITMLVLMTS